MIPGLDQIRSIYFPRPHLATNSGQSWRATRGPRSHELKEDAKKNPRGRRYTRMQIESPGAGTMLREQAIRVP